MRTLRIRHLCFDPKCRGGCELKWPVHIEPAVPRRRSPWRSTVDWQYTDWWGPAPVAGKRVKTLCNYLCNRAIRWIYRFANKSERTIILTSTTVVVISSYLFHFITITNGCTGETIRNSQTFGKISSTILEISCTR